MLRQFRASILRFVSPRNHFIGISSHVFSFQRCVTVDALAVPPFCKFPALVFPGPTAIFWDLSRTEPTMKQFADMLESCHSSMRNSLLKRFYQSVNGLIWLINTNKPADFSHNSQKDSKFSMALPGVHHSEDCRCTVSILLSCYWGSEKPTSKDHMRRHDKKN